MIKSLSSLALLLVLHTRNNTDGNKLMILSGIACTMVILIYNAVTLNIVPLAYYLI